MKPPFAYFGGKHVYRGVTAIALTLTLTSGCSSDDRPTVPDHLRCIAAHDEWHSDFVRFLCDRYVPSRERQS